MKGENKKGLYRTSKDTVIDESTGEVLESRVRTEKVFLNMEPSYVKLYIDDIVRLKDLPSSSANFLLLVVGNMGYNNIFQAYKPIKKIMAEQLGMTLNTINQRISDLKEKGILIPIEGYGRGLYLVDPNLFAKGRWNDIRELRLTIGYHPDGTRSLTSNVPKLLEQFSMDQGIAGQN